MKFCQNNKPRASLGLSYLFMFQHQYSVANIKDTKEKLCFYQIIIFIIFQNQFLNP
jgi:hypothetical protein